MTSWFTSDNHIDQQRIGEFRQFPEWAMKAAKGSPVKANRIWQAKWWDENIGRNHIVHTLGDVSFGAGGLPWFGDRPGEKRLKLGNHDEQAIALYMLYFSDIRGIQKHKQGFWSVHAPVHPDELRGKFCVHGHVHYETLPDWRYINVCCDNLQQEIGQPMISMDSLIKTMDRRRKTKKVEFVL